MRAGFADVGYRRTQLTNVVVVIDGENVFDPWSVEALGKIR